MQIIRDSILRVGTDIKGSVCIPAAFNDIFSLKPTTERVLYQEIANTNSSQNKYRSTISFLTNSFGGPELMLRSILSTKPCLIDLDVVSMFFRRKIIDIYFSQAKRIGTAKLLGPQLKLDIL